MPRTIGQGVALVAMLEKEWDFQLFNSRNGLASTLGWTLCYHTLRSKGSQSGFPDRVLVRERIIYAELKRELTGKKSEDANRQPSPSQREWLDGLASAGAEVYLWRPSDLEEIGLVLGTRWLFSPAHEGAEGMEPSHLQRGDSWMVPRSGWIPGVGRADELSADVH